MRDTYKQDPTNDNRSMKDAKMQQEVHPNEASKQASTVSTRS